MQVVRVSGTIKKAEEEAIRRARISIRRAQKASKKGNMVTGLNATDDQNLNLGNDEDGVVDMGFANGIEDPDEPGDLNHESD